MNLKEVYSANSKTIISFEVFPPKDDLDGEKLNKLLYNLTILKNYNPLFISLTYGAGGSTQNSSLNIIKNIQNELKIPVMPHFTCVGSSRNQVIKYLEELKELDITNILALRGDIPEGFEQIHFDFNYANELVEFLKQRTDFSIGVAGYPEGHINCPDLETDLRNLKKKVDAGSDAIYTQMFFDNEKFYSFMDNARYIGVKAPIIPGILPIISYNQLERMLSMAKVSVPKDLRDKLEKYKDNPEDIKKIGLEHTTNQCKDLIKQGVCGLHFFTMNTSKPVCKILDELNL